MLFERYGLQLGVLLVLVVSFTAVFLGRTAARNVSRFREEHHQRFQGRKHS